MNSATSSSSSPLMPVIPQSQARTAWSVVCRWVEPQLPAVALLPKPEGGLGAFGSHEAQPRQQCWRGSSIRLRRVGVLDTTRSFQAPPWLLCLSCTSLTRSMPNRPPGGYQRLCQWFSVARPTARPTAIKSTSGTATGRSYLSAVRTVHPKTDRQSRSRMAYCPSWR